MAALDIVTRKNFKKQYRNQKWFDYSEKVKIRDKYACTNCGRKDVILQVHHLEYKTGYDIWQYPLSSCVTLCKGCHAEEHNIIEPRSGWALLSIYDNQFCDSVCERDGCGKDIRYEHNVYHPMAGYKTVGSTCVDFLTQDYKNISSYISNISKSITSFIDNSEWNAGKTKNGTSFIKHYYKGYHECRIYGSYPNYAIQVGRKRLGRWYFDYSKIYKVQNKTLDEAKELVYLIARGWTSDSQQEKETIRDMYLLSIS